MSSRPHFRRLFLPLLIAVALGVQAAGTVLALGPRSAPVAPVVAPIAESATDRQPLARSESAAPVTDATPRQTAVREVARRVVTPTAQTIPAQAAVSPKVTASTTTKSTGSSATTATTVYRGKNHVWIPSLGINRDVVFFPCSRSKPPGHQIYSWGCAGKNNVYLFGHAASVMKPLYNAYYSKRLKVGMKVVYADGNGKVRTYKVTTWKVVLPENSAWAIAAQSRPSMTLQTCVGANSKYRLVVRLVAV
jgi:sortase (surface protein transpeptidase)